MNGIVTFDAVTGGTSFLPALNFNGRASFDVTVSDGVNQTKATVLVRVTPVDDVPVIPALTLQAVPGKPLSVPVVGLVERLVDPDLETISFRRVVGATHGTATYNLATGMITFIPADGFAGQASVTYEVVSGGVPTQGVITVNVDAVNAGHSDREIDTSMRAGATLDLSLATLAGPGLDLATPGARVVIVSAPAVGQLLQQPGGGVAYIAPDSFTGHVFFDYKVIDHAGAESTGHVSVVVRVNSAPTVAASSVTTDEDTPIVFSIASLLANARDADGDVLRLVSASANSGARVVIDFTAQTVTYTPRANVFGTDRLIYGVSDGKRVTNGAVEIQINPVNDAPIARADTIELQVGQTLRLPKSAFLDNDSDLEGSALSLVGVTSAQNGTASIDAVTGDVIFVPSITNGYATFSYIVSDGDRQSIGKVNIQVDRRADLLAALADTTIEIPFARLLANDPQGQPLTIVRTEMATRGTAVVDGASGVIRFTPETGFRGTASFRYVSSDGTTETVSTVRVMVVAKDAPLASNDAFATTVDIAVDIPVSTLLSNDLHPSAKPLSLVSVGDAVGGSVVLDGTTIRFTPDAGSRITGSFRYTVTDGAAIAIGTVSVPVRENRAPTFRATALSVLEDTPLVLSFADAVARFADPEGRTLTFVRAESGLNGTVTVDTVARTLTFRGDTNFAGAASFTLVVSDGVNEAAGEVQVNIRPVDDAPVLSAPILFSATIGKPLIVSVEAILAAFTDVDGGAFSFGRVVGASSGQATLDLSRQWITVSSLAQVGQETVVTFEYLSVAGRTQASFTVRAVAAAAAGAMPNGPMLAQATSDQMLATAAAPFDGPSTAQADRGFALPSQMVSADQRALVLPAAATVLGMPPGTGTGSDLAMAGSVAPGVVAASSTRDQSMLLAALLAGGVNLSAYRKVSQRRAVDTDTLLSPFLANDEEEDAPMPLWDEGDEDGFVRVGSNLGNRQTMTGVI